MPDMGLIRHYMRKAAQLADKVQSGEIDNKEAAIGALAAAIREQASLLSGRDLWLAIMQGQLAYRAARDAADRAAIFRRLGEMLREKRKKSFLETITRLSPRLFKIWALCFWASTGIVLVICEFSHQIDNYYYFLLEASLGFSIWLVCFYVDTNRETNRKTIRFRVIFTSIAFIIIFANISLIVLFKKQLRLGFLVSN